MTNFSGKNLDKAEHQDDASQRGNLPEGWVETPLGEYLYLKNGYAFKSNSYVAKDEDTVPVIRISDIDGKLATDETAIHVKKVDVVGGFEIKKGDLLIAMSGATTGKVGVYSGSEPAYQNQRVGNLKLHSDAFGSAKYKDHLIASLTPEILKVAYGGAQPNISGKAIEEFLVALPPLAEQQQIAQKLDELLAQVDTLKTRLDAIPNILKRFRQSVLAAAVSGRLTEEWRGLNKLNHYWEELTFNAICEEITVGFVGKMKDQYIESGVPFLRSQNVRKFKFSPENILYISEAFHKEIYKSRLNAGDLAIVRSGAPGTTCVIPKNMGEMNCSDLVIARPGAKLLSDYGCIFMNSEVAQKNVSDNQVGVAQQHFNVGSMKKMPISLPSLQEQTEIVRRVEQLFAYAAQIEQRVKDAQARVNHLTQSILAKAFRGELTAEWRTQNPELISGENSAAALLERIKAEREVTAKPKRKIKA